MEEREEKEMKIEFPLSDIVEEECHVFQALAKVCGKNSKHKYCAERFLGDEKAIRSLVTILLDNAVKYANEKVVLQ